MKQKLALRSLAYGGVWAFLICGGKWLEIRSKTMSFSIPASVLKEEPSSVELPDGRVTFWHQPDGGLELHLKGKPNIDPVSITLGGLLIGYFTWSHYCNARKEEEAKLEKERQKKEELERLAESPEYQDFLAEHPERSDSRIEEVIDDFISWRAIRRNRARAQVKKIELDAS
jgi:hypothetical protein